ncbi:MAG: thymidine phosphorylase [candidate division WOR-3 bacterium]|nr:thymidine phosphorylase [candidate division WOR-3 bacterium]
MTAYEIILKKRDGKELSYEEIQFMVNGLISGTIPEYQFSAFLMAIYFRGMNFKETAALTQVMINSGNTINLSQIPGPKVDKHSTGGVGDKVSLVLAPLVASLEVCVPMISGRALGHTGGTLDKLESIPGFRTILDEEEFIKILKNIGIAIIGQSSKLVPADKKIYALRDVTATVDSIPLIAASIMSKKLAEGIDGLVLDIKVGKGAFMKTLKDAKKLGQTMCAIGKLAKKKVCALLTNMYQPLGNTVGNALEVIEAIQTLKGQGPKDLLEITLNLGAEMLKISRNLSYNASRKLLINTLLSGKALEKFRMFVKLQGGDDRVIENYNILPQPKYKLPVVSPKTGYIAEIDAFKIGLLSVELGCGRKTISDTIDHSAGFIFQKKIGEKVTAGEEIALVCGNDLDKVLYVREQVINAYKISNKKVSPPKLLLGKIT